MLFEKVPLLCGSGVIPNRFEDFKAGIKTLIISEFFTREHIERFFAAMEMECRRPDRENRFKPRLYRPDRRNCGNAVGLDAGNGQAEPKPWNRCGNRSPKS